MCGQGVGKKNNSWFFWNIVENIIQSNYLTIKGLKIHREERLLASSVLDPDDLKSQEVRWRETKKNEVKGDNKTKSKKERMNEKRDTKQKR